MQPKPVSVFHSVLLYCHNATLWPHLVLYRQLNYLVLPSGAKQKCELTIASRQVGFATLGQQGIYLHSAGVPTAGANSPSENQPSHQRGRGVSAPWLCRWCDQAQHCCISESALQTQLHQTPSKPWKKEQLVKLYCESCTKQHQHTARCHQETNLTTRGMQGGQNRTNLSYLRKGRAKIKLCCAPVLNSDMHTAWARPCRRHTDLHTGPASSQTRPASLTHILASVTVRRPAGI